LKLNHQRQVIAADVRTKLFLDDADRSRNEAMVERDSREWHPSGPRPKEAAALRCVLQAAVAEQFAEIRTPRRRVQIAKNNRKLVTLADLRRNFPKLLIS